MNRLFYFICFCSFTFSSYSYAVTLNQFTINRDGGGQINAVIAESDEGMKITLKECNFRTLPEGASVKVMGKDVVEENDLYY